MVEDDDGITKSELLRRLEAFPDDSVICVSSYSSIDVYPPGPDGPYTVYAEYPTCATEDWEKYSRG